MIDGGEQEEEDADDGDGEDSSVQFACSLESERISNIDILNRDSLVGLSTAKWCSDEAGAAVGTVSGLPCDVDECADEADVENDGNGTEEGASSKAENEQDGQDGVQGSSTSNAFNRSPFISDVDVVVGQNL